MAGDGSHLRWDWPVDLVTAHARTIMTGSPQDIERIAAEGLEQQQ
ncbi:MULTISPECIES: hypothetical protein [unclassified Streptomyces]